MKTCRECNAPISDPRPVTLFCSTSCRYSFHNRRSMRGAVLYDLWMAHRYERPVAKALGIFAMLCALGQKYREEDRERGHWAVSWLSPDTVLAAKPWLKALVPGRDTNREGEGSPDG